MKLEELLENPELIQKQIEIGKTALEKIKLGKYSIRVQSDIRITSGEVKWS